MRIIYKNGNGVAFVSPTPKDLDKMMGTENEKLTQLADQLLPAGTKYEIVSDADVDKSVIGNRDAWKYVSGDNELISAGEVN